MPQDKYWNDIWIVSYSENLNEDIVECDNCGAVMKKNEKNNILECDYCKSSIYYNFNVQNWKIVDIEVNNDSTIQLN